MSVECIYEKIFHILQPFAVDEQDAISAVIIEMSNDCSFSEERLRNFFIENKRNTPFSDADIVIEKTNKKFPGNAHINLRGYQIAQQTDLQTHADSNHQRELNYLLEE